MRIRPLPASLAAGLLVLAAAIVWDEAWLRPLAQRYVREHAGRRLDFERVELRLDGALRPVLRLHGLSIENAPWAKSREPLIRAALFEMVFDWASLGDERWIVHHMRLVGAQVDLERRADGLRNWRLGSPENRGPGKVRVRRLVAERSSLTTWQEGLELELAFRSEPLDGAEAGGAPASVARPTQRVRVSGSRSGVRFEGSFAVGPVLSFYDTGEPFALRGELASGGSRLAVDGTLTDLFQFAGLDVAVRAEAPRGFADLVTVARGARGHPVWLPALPSELSAARVSKARLEWHFEGVALKVGRSDAAGSGTWHEAARSPAAAAAAGLAPSAATASHPAVPPASASASGASLAGRSRWEGRWTSRRVDWAELRTAVLSDTARLRRTDDTPHPSSRAGVAGALAASAPPLPRGAPQPPRFEADLEWQVAVIDGIPAGPIEQLRLAGTIDGGRWKTRALAFDIAGGHVDGQARYDADASPRRLAVDLRLARAQLARWHVEPVSGALDAHLAVDASGDNVDALLENARGRLAGSLSHGSIDARLSAKVELDGGRWLRALLDRDGRVPLRCAVFDLGIERGAARLRRLAAENDDWRLAGTGAIDFSSRTLDLLLTPERKHAALLALDRSIRLRGPIATPKITLAPREQGEVAGCEGRSGGVRD